jgi:hypothetical protein
MKKRIVWMILFNVLLCSALRYEVALALEGDSSCQKDSTKIVELDLSKVLESPPIGFVIIGKPVMIDCPYGKAVQFNGLDDAIMLDTNLLANMQYFTIEVLIRPDTSGEPAQRFLHFGEVKGERVMVETRLTKDNQWYLDTYMKSGQIGQTLADSTKLHPLNQWYHVAFVVDSGKMEAFVNGKRELQGQIPFSPFTLGQTSIGVRLNRINWYKGAISKMRITPWKLEPHAFKNF